MAESAAKVGNTLVRGTSVVSGLTLLSRLLGFVRDLLVARLFGTGNFADAFFVAFRIPNLLRSVFAEGALSSAFVPIFSGDLIKGRSVAAKTFAVITGFLLCSSVLITIAGEIWADKIVELFAPGFVAGSPKSDLCVLLTRIMLPYIVFVSLVALMGAALNAVEIFGQAAWAQVIMNLVLIAGAWLAGLFEQFPAVIILAVSVLLGGAAQIVAQIPALSRSQLLQAPSFALFSPTIAQLLKLMLPAVLGSAIYQISIFLNTLFASYLAPGSVAWLFYADRLAQLPLGVFSIALASVLLPLLARAHAKQAEADFAAHLSDSLRYTSFIIIPVSTFMFVMAEPLIRVLFERGAFDYDSSRKTALVVKALALGLWGTSCHSVLLRAFVAKRDTLTPTLIGVAALLCSTFLALLFMGTPVVHTESSLARAITSFQNSFSAWGIRLDLKHAGLGLASSLAALFAFLVALWLQVTRASLVTSDFFKATLKACAASLFMALVLAQLIKYYSNPYLILMESVAAAIVLYALASWILASREFQETLALFLRLKGRKLPDERNNSGEV